MASSVDHYKCRDERESHKCIKKPRIGDEVWYTEKGAEFYQLSNGRPPENDGYVGKVISRGAIGAMNIITVQDENGDTDCFIWRFSDGADGANDHIQWGKQEQER